MHRCYFVKLLGGMKDVDFFCNKYYARPHLKYSGCPLVIPFCHKQTPPEYLGVTLKIVPRSH